MTWFIEFTISCTHSCFPLVGNILRCFVEVISKVTRFKEIMVSCIRFCCLNAGYVLRGLFEVISGDEREI